VPITIIPKPHLGSEPEYGSCKVSTSNHRRKQAVQLCSWIPAISSTIINRLKKLFSTVVILPDKLSNPRP
jgi:hypothetical protein